MKVRPPVCKSCLMALYTCAAIQKAVPTWPAIPQTFLLYRKENAEVMDALVTTARQTSPVPCLHNPTDQARIELIWGGAAAATLDDAASCYTVRDQTRARM